MKAWILIVGISIMSFAWPGWSEEIIMDTLTQSTTSWDGKALPSYSEGQPEITILRFTIPPGKQLGSHLHSVINAGVLLSGRLTVIAEDNREIRLEAGDPLIELVDQWHYGKNEGDEPAVILVFYAGVKGQSLTLHQVEDLSEDQP